MQIVYTVKSRKERIGYRFVSSEGEGSELNALNLNEILEDSPESIQKGVRQYLYLYGVCDVSAVYFVSQENVIKAICRPRSPRKNKLAKLNAFVMSLLSGCDEVHFIADGVVKDQKDFYEYLHQMEALRKS